MHSVNRKNDEGAIAVLSAILISALFIAVSAIAIDAGALLVEKRELQNVADAGALAIANDCVEDMSACTQENADAKAASMASLNSTDGETNAAVTLDLSEHKVTVLSSTKSGSATVMPSWFSGNDDNGTVTATATVSWETGLGSYASSLAITFSGCEWDGATDPNGDGDRVFGPLPPYGTSTPFPSAASYEVILKTHTVNGNDCDFNSSSGLNYPGGFGWLDGDGCTADVTVGDPPTYEGNTGAPKLEDGCRGSYLPTLAGQRQVRYVPIFLGHGGNGNSVNGSYTLRGFAAFVVTGVRNIQNTSDVASWVTGRHLNHSSYNRASSGDYPGSSLCANGEVCISGFFVKDLTTTGPGGGDDFGVPVDASPILID
jgi:Flp pilus assembly protein TadG